MKTIEFPRSDQFSGSAIFELVGKLDGALPSGRAQRERDPGRVKGIKDATFAEKNVWILRIQNTKLEWARRTNGLVPNEAQWYRVMKKKFTGVPSYSCLRTYVQTLGRADVEEVEEVVKAKSKKGGNRKNPNATFNDAMQAKIDAIFKKDRYTTNKELAADLGVSIPTAIKYKGLAGWVVRMVRRITLLTPQHRSDRKSWCNKEKGNQMRNRAMIDEKQFVVVPPATMNVKVEDGEYVVAAPNENDNDENEPPAGVETPKKRKKAGIATDFVDEKKHGVKLMVTSCVMRPIRNANGSFKTTGKVGIWISKVTIHTAQRKSANHEKGEIYEEWGGSVVGKAYLDLIEIPLKFLTVASASRCGVKGGIYRTNQRLKKGEKRGGSLKNYICYFYD